MTLQVRAHAPSPCWWWPRETCLGRQVA